MSSPRADQARIAQLRQLLDEGGRSWAQMGKLMGCSKNAIAGLIRRHVYGRQNGFKNPALKDAPPRKPYSRKKRPPVVVKLPVPVVRLPPPPPVPVGECQWPVNNRRPWRFCEAVTEPGLPYCDAHCLIAYHKRPAWAA